MLPYHWVRASYLLAAASSATAHVYVLTSTILSSNPALSFAEMYVPFVRTDVSGTEDLLLIGPWLFLQFDLIIMALAGVSWVYILLVDLMDDRRSTRIKFVLALLTNTVLLGVGTSVSVALFWREGILERRRNQTEANDTETKERRI